MDGYACRRCASRVEPGITGAYQTHQATGRALRHAPAANHQRGGISCSRCERPPQEDGSSMELKSGYKQTEVGIIPTCWELVHLGDKAVKVGSGITPTGGARVYKSTGRPFVRSQNVGWGSLLMEDVAFIDNETHESFCGTEIEVGDVFLNITGASIGRSA